MGVFWNYLRIQLKRICKVFLPTFGMTLMLLAGISLLAFFMVKSNQEKSDEPQKYQIGIVGNTDDPYLSLGIAAVSEMDPGRFEFDFVVLDEKAAIDGIRTGKLSAYMVIPEGFLESVMTGENKKIQFVSSEGTVDIGTILLNEVVGVVSKMITESQAAGSGLYEVMKQNGLLEFYGTYSNIQDFEAIKRILNRSQIFEVETYQEEPSISFAGYYVCGILLFFLMIFGINASGILAEKNQAMQKMLKSGGYGSFLQVLAEYAAYLVLMFLSVFGIAFLAWAGMKVTGKMLPEWNYATEAIVFPFVIRILPVLLVVSAFQFFLYECTCDVISGILLQFLMAVSLSYISGCFYPISFFPEIIAKINRILPTGIAMNYLCNCITEKNVVQDGMKLLGEAMIFTVISFLIRNARLNRAENPV